MRFPPFFRTDMRLSALSAQDPRDYSFFLLSSISAWSFPAGKIVKLLVLFPLEIIMDVEKIEKRILSYDAQKIQRNDGSFPLKEFD